MERAQDTEGQPQKRVKVQESELEQLRRMSEVVADTGDFNQLQKYNPSDSTTNPSLILQVAKQAAFTALLQASVNYALDNFTCHCTRAKKKGAAVVWKDLDAGQRGELIDLALDHLCVSIGVKILEKIKGLVSTEVQARLSFDTAETVRRAKRIIALYNEAGVASDRILIKVATTWEGVKAAEMLLKSKIRCNMTLVFHLVQAVACAQRKLFLISPFVGRILDWYKKDTGLTYTSEEDPGVRSVRNIYNYFKANNYKTLVMGASFRSTAEIKALAGCDKLTISPALLEQLCTGRTEVQQVLSVQSAVKNPVQEIDAEEKNFRYQLNKSKMATDLLAAGIRKFQEDANQVKNMIRARLEEMHKPRQ